MTVPDLTLSSGIVLTEDDLLEIYSRLIGDKSLQAALVRRITEQQTSIIFRDFPLTGAPYNMRKLQQDWYVAHGFDKALARALASNKANPAWLLKATLQDLSTLKMIGEQRLAEITRWQQNIRTTISLMGSTDE